MFRMFKSQKIPNIQVAKSKKKKRKPTVQLATATWDVPMPRKVKRNKPTKYLSEKTEHQCTG